MLCCLRRGWTPSAPLNLSFNCERMFVHCFKIFKLQQHGNRKAFQCIFQESVCSTFGCGLSSACVVDVGDEKTSICCVEDGLLVPNTKYVTLIHTQMHSLKPLCVFASPEHAHILPKRMLEICKGEQSLYLLYNIMYIQCGYYQVGDHCKFTLFRLWLLYGGRDITRCFFWLLKKV